MTSHNLAPRGGLTGPARSVPGWARTFTLSGTDPGPADRADLRYEVDWGDGQAETFLGGARWPAAHAYATPGTYTVRLTVIDKEGTAGPESRRTVTVVPTLAAGGTLYAGGTAADDVIVIVGGRGTAADMAINGTVVAAGWAGPVTVFANDGDDTVATVGPVRARVWSCWAGPGTTTWTPGRRSARWCSPAGPGTTRWSAGPAATC